MLAFKKYQSWLILSAFILLAIFILSPSVHYQFLIAQGDHGRDFYAFERTLHGDKPYQDYWWVYGPLMPYVYAFVFKIFGVSIANTLWTESFFQLLAAIFFYLALTRLVSLPLSLIGGFWFLIYQQPFFYTYNHIAAITLMMVLMFLVFDYIKKPSAAHLFYGTLICVIIGLIKINFGVVNFICFLVSLAVIDKAHNSFYTSYQTSRFKKSFLFFTISLLAIYAYFLWGLKIYEIRQCLPYLSADHPYHLGIFKSAYILANETIANLFLSPLSIAFAVFILISFLQTISLALSRKTALSLKKNILLTVAILSLFYTANLHEYLSSGVFYRAFWAKPFNIFFIFFFINCGLRSMPRLVKACGYIALSFILLFAINDRFELFLQQKRTAFYLDFPKGKIYTGNDAVWNMTVYQTTLFLKNNLKQDDLFFALPYDPLYYFLTDKKSPTRQLIFFDHINISPQQDESVIAELEKNHVNWTVLSSRIKSHEEGLGEFGQTYCPRLAQYLYTHFEKVAEFGDWQNEPGWAWNHGTRIYKRIK